MNMTIQKSMFSRARESNDGYYLVEQLRTQRAHKIATLRHDDMTELTVPLPRHACVSEHDTLIIRGNSIYVKTHDHAVSVFPAFRYETQVKFGASTHTLVVREITNEQDYEAYCNLRQFHYLSNKSLEDEESEYSQSHSSHESDTGRHVALYAELTINGRKYSAGYTDLGASLLGHPVRIKIFDEDYHDPERNLSMKFEVRHRDLVQVSNRTCRMRRVVVHPDFRSIGLTHLITNAALEYARTRYVFGGYCAHFCESSAEMLNYVPFRHREGWHFGGMSMGNHDKIIGYLKVEIRDHGVNALNRSVSEMQTRKKWGRIFLHYCESRGISFDEGLQLVQRFLDDDDNAAHDVETWAMLRSITVDSKPYYMLGLSDYANEYIKRAISTITFRAKEQKYFDRITRAHDVIERDVKIECKRLTVRAKYELLDNRVTRSLLNAFGLSGRAVYSNILENVRFEASSGDVIMVVGGSGCGKSMLLDCLDTSHEAHDNLDVRCRMKRNYRVARPRAFDALDMPFDVLSETHGVDRTFSAFSRMGLAEAFVLIKPFWMLSRGQQYRVMLADLLLRDDDVWMIDEFCADLDAISARVVSMNLRKQVKRTNRIAIVAAANHAHYVEALQPTRVAVMRTGENIEWHTFDQYMTHVIK